MSTWRGLYRLLDSAGVHREQFFFTNVYVGLKEGAPTGQFTGHDAPLFRRWCSEFLATQVTTMRPRVVLVLGGPANRDVAIACEPQPWPPGPLPPPEPRAVRLYGHPTVLVPAHHPSMQKRIVRDALTLGRAWRTPCT